MGADIQKPDHDREVLEEQEQMPDEQEEQVPDAQEDLVEEAAGTEEEQDLWAEMEPEEQLPEEQEQLLQEEPEGEPIPEEEPMEVGGGEEPAPAAEKAVAEEPTRAGRRLDGGAWLGGLVLIVLGLVFLLRTVANIDIGNWWALFILIPAVGSLVAAYRAWREAGNINFYAANGLVAGTIILLVAIIFLFQIDWSRIWPLFLIIIGIGALLGGFSRR